MYVHMIIARLRIQKQECYHESGNSESYENQKTHHHTRHSKFMENANYIQEQQTQEYVNNIHFQIDDLTCGKFEQETQNLTSGEFEQATQEVGKNENIELVEYDGPEKEEESSDPFKETLATGWLSKMRCQCTR